MDKITQVLFSDIGKVTTQYVEVPHQQLKPHEVRIAPVFYGICGSDLHVLKGGHPFAKPPVVPGHEIAARVTEVGSDVKNVQPGDHVVVDPIMACMECRACKAGRFNLCEPPQVAGFRAPGFARSQHIVPARNCHVAPASLPLKVLAFAEPAACARHCVNRMPKASLESVLVIGAGTIGLSIVQALRIMGAGKITVIEPDAAKRALALKLGAAEVWAPGELAADVRFTGAIDVVAAQATLNDACTRVYAGGTVVCMGVPSGPHASGVTRKRATFWENVMVFRLALRHRVQQKRNSRKKQRINTVVDMASYLMIVTANAPFLAVSWQPCRRGNITP